MENFKIDVDADGIALVTFDVAGRSMNTLTGQVMAEIPQVVERIKTDEAIKGAVLTSGKPSGFCAGADLGDQKRVLTPGQARAAGIDHVVVGRPITAAADPRAAAQAIVAEMGEA